MDSFSDFSRLETQASALYSLSEEVEKRTAIFASSLSLENKTEYLEKVKKNRQKEVMMLKECLKGLQFASVDERNEYVYLNYIRRRDKNVHYATLRELVYCTYLTKYPGANLP